MLILGKLVTTISIFLGLLLIGSSDMKINNKMSLLNKYKITHIHGLGYIGDNNDIYFAEHAGLLRYSKGKWYKTPYKQEYLGFQPYKDGFYSSGHPDISSNYKDPLGLIKSTNFGRTLEKLAFYGESDFHHLAVSYNNQTVYAINEVPNRKLYTGIFYTQNEGETWKQSLLYGLTSKSVSKIAVHPSDSSKFAIATKDGLFYSTNYGNQFQLITLPSMITSVHFEEKSILYSSITGEKVFLTIQYLNTMEEEILSLPTLTKENPIIHISSNPHNTNEMVIYTMKNDTYITLNRGKEWKRITSEGKIINIQ